MNNPDSPNYLGLFLHLRDAGMSLTVEQYLLFQQALTLGFGQSNLADLKQLCRLLWFKPKASFNSDIFDTEFDRYFAQFQSQKLPETPLKPETIPTPPTPEITPNQTTSTPDKIPTPKPSNSIQIPIALRGEGFQPHTSKKTSQQLITSLKKHTFGKTQIYYFRNCPHNYLYLCPNQPQAKPLDEILPTLHKNRTIVVIFSDGGAGRGNYNSERIELTQVFFDQIEPLVRSLIWLNPLPEDRWQNTTASGIIETLNLPMFEFNCSGLKNIRNRVFKLT